MLILNKNILTIGGNRLEGGPLTPPTPPGPTPLPSNTIRCKFKSDYTPDMGDTQTLVDSTNNIWDIYKESNSWTKLFNYNNNLLEVISANTSNVTSMSQMFYYCTSLTSVSLFNTSSVIYMTSMFIGCKSLTTVNLFDTSSVTYINGMFNGCTSLTSVPLFDTSSATNIRNMFGGCTSLTTVPLFDTSKVTDMRNTFYNCSNVQSGALALYQQASTQTTPPSRHDQTFYNCGINTTTGAAELAQIPSSWGGTGA